MQNQADPSASVSRAQLLANIAKVMKQHPRLTANGFDTRRKLPQTPINTVPDEVQAALDYLDGTHMRVVKAKDESPNSYHVKHCAERWYQAQGKNVYVSNGAMIAACVIAEIPIQWGRAWGMNAGIGVHRIDLKKTERASFADICGKRGVRA